MMPYKAQYTYNSSSPSDSESYSNPPKRIKYDDNHENMIFRAGYTNLHNEHIYTQQRAQVLQMQDDRSSIASTASSMDSSQDGFPPTPPPDFAMSVGQHSLPLFPNHSRNPVEPPPLRYFQLDAQFSAPGRTPAEHNYAVGYPRDSPAAVSVIQAPQSAMRPARARFTSDSDSSVVTDPDEINPMCMNDWFRGAVRPELDGQLTHELATIEYRARLREERYTAMRMHEVPTELEYNPNKSRLRKDYVSSTEEAERSRNNLASRKSRFRRKNDQLINNIKLDFHRQENAEMYALQNWMDQVIFELEEACLNTGVAPESLADLRQQCGFQLSLLYRPGSSSSM
ncbi:uncharacterized protein LOC109411250 isoform X1 [Aedes albopictus]|uniref:BZIP domain-containing protein n=1 Tax=Aedes albopictus TaxID=7160 RepID=A0ABM1ZZ99_AEDAL